MPDVPLVLGRFASHAVDVNGVMVPGRSVERVLARHAFNLLVHNDDPIYRVSLRGSATALRYKGWSLVIATQHQLVDVDRQRIAMLTDDSVAVTSGGWTAFSPSPDTDANDLVAFDFTEPCAARADLRPRFFNLPGPPVPMLGGTAMAVLLSGYPSRDQAYEVEEKNHLGLGRRQVVCQVAEDQPSDTALVRLNATSPLPHDPDGMSGGSAFVIDEADGYMRAYFAGIVVRGGLDTFHIIKAQVVLRLLDQSVEQGLPASP